MDSVETSFADEDLMILVDYKLNMRKQCVIVRNTNSTLHWNSTVAASKVHVDGRRDDEKIAAREILIANKEEKNHSGDDQVLD